MRFILFITLLISVTASAQPLVPENSEAMPSILLSEPGLKEMQLTQLDVDVKVNQSFSKTSMTMTFRNPNDRVLAGDLVFPLPEGALVSGYALDINGVMVDGSIVKKEKARQVLETEIRKGVDPGLIEFTQGNNYRTRIFPIPAKGVRVIRVSYVSDLIFNSDSRLYNLPLGFKDKIEQFDLKISVVKAGSSPKLLDNALSNFNFRQWENGFVAQTQMKDVTLTKPVIVEIPQIKNNDVAIEQGPDGQYYFSIAHKVNNGKSQGEAIRPKHLSIIWDASGSREDANHEREYDILTAYIKTLAKINKQTLTVHLTLLRNTLVPAKKFRIVDGSSSKLIEYLKQVNYDGGTQFGSLDGSSLYKDVDLHLIFTDGLTNFGHTYKDQLAAPTAIISGDSRSDHALLNYIAETTGGSYFNLNKHLNEEVINKIGVASYSYLSSEVISGSVADVLPTSPQVIGDYLIFSGKLNSDQASLKLKFRDIDQNQHSVIYDLDRSVATNGNLLRTVWGQAKVNELLIHDKDNSQAFVELGKTYHLVTPETSLLVLETIEQYVEHEVIPPNSFPELQAEYDRRLTKISSQKIKYEEEKIESIVTQWNERIAWWNTNFSLVAAKEEKLSIGAQIDSAVLRSPAESISVHANARVREEPLGTADVYDEIGLEESVVSGARSDEVMEDNAPESKDAVIQLTAWDPATPYLEKLKSVKSDQQITTYFSLRKEYRSSIPFFFDCAEYFYQQGEQDFALQILSNITELELDNPSLNRIVAHRLRQAGELELSQLMFEEVIRLRPEEPQSYRDLAFVLTEMAQYEEAIELLYSVILKKWTRFDGIEMVVLNELNHVIDIAKKNGVSEFDVDPRLIKLLDLGIRIVMTWSTDMTDIDLHVEEPNGEIAFYQNNRTRIGGLVSKDFTQGYGPEEYLIKKPQDGIYKIRAKYYSNNSRSAIGPVTVQLDIFTNYGRDNEQHQTTTIRLEDHKEMHAVGEIEF